MPSLDRPFAALTALQPGLPGIEVDSTIFRPATFIEQAMANLTATLLIGAGLVALILLALFLHLRLALISLVAIPLALVAAALVLHLRGATLNALTLLGLMIALGVVIDDAVVDTENVARRLRQRSGEAGGTSVASSVVEAVVEMRRPLLFATLITALLVLPAVFLQGVFGALFQPLALSYALALAASMAVALLVTPALSLILLSWAPPAGRGPGLMRWLQRGYAALLALTLRSPLPALVIVAAVVAAGIAVAPSLGLQSLLPSFRESQLLIQWEGTPGASHPEMTRITLQASRDLRAVPGVTNVGAHVGRAILGDEVVGINAAKIWVSLDPTADYEATVAAVQEVVDRYPGLVRQAQTYTQKSLIQVLSGSSDAMVVRVFGPEWGSCVRRRRRSSRPCRGSTASSACSPSSWSRSPLWNSRSTSKKPRSMASSPATSVGRWPR